jgi:hypothetical protein
MGYRYTCDAFECECPDAYRFKVLLCVGRKLYSDMVILSVPAQTQVARSEPGLGSAISGEKRRKDSGITG